MGETADLKPISERPIINESDPLYFFRNDIIRIISARKATKKERYFYETESRH